MSTALVPAASADGRLPPWTKEQLDAFRREATRIFVAQYVATTKDVYATARRSCEDALSELFAETDDLLYLDNAAKLAKPLAAALRYVTAPSISEDTLRLVGAEYGEMVTVKTFLDRARFPWVQRGQRPSSAERDLALTRTADIWSDVVFRANNRKDASGGQEALVKAVLDHAGYTHVERTRVTGRVRHAGPYDAKQGLEPANWRPGLEHREYTDEIPLVKNKADVLLRLSDLLVPIECKVSNTEVNSTKRLKHEALGKHKVWQQEFGARHTAPIAVLGGAFSLTNLVTAQDDGLVLIFDHQVAEVLPAFLAQLAARA